MRLSIWLVHLEGDAKCYMTPILEELIECHKYVLHPQTLYTEVQYVYMGMGMYISLYS